MCTAEWGLHVRLHVIFLGEKEYTLNGLLEGVPEVPIEVRWRRKANKMGY